MSVDLIEKLRIRDAVGRPLTAGAAVRSTAHETPFVKTMSGVVVDAKADPPTLAVCWGDDARPFWHRVDLMWRCMDIRLAEQQDKGTEEKA